MGICILLFWIIARSDPGMLLLGVDKLCKLESQLRSDDSPEEVRRNEPPASLTRFEYSLEVSDFVNEGVCLLCVAFGKTERLVPRSWLEPL